MDLTRLKSVPLRFARLALAAALGVAATPAAAQVSLTTLGAAYTQDFNTLGSSGTSSGVPAGWAFSESGTNANTTYAAGTGSDNAGNTYSFGASGNTERAFGGLRSGSLVPTIGARFTNDTGFTISSLAIDYVGEQWRLGQNTAGRAADRLDFQISTNATDLTTGTWTDVNALDFNSPVVSGTVGALNGNVSPNRTAISTIVGGLSIANGATFWIRWTDSDLIPGADDGLAVDDFSLTPFGSTPPTGVGAATPASGLSGTSTLLTVTVTPGANPASTGISVSADLSGIGGANPQPFYDDGTHGDVTTGDGVFSYQATATGSAGVKSLPFTVSDAQLRSTNGSIAFTIDPPLVAIHDIQGNGNTSPYAGQLVKTTGIVTAKRFNNGFFLQQPDATVDGDPATSEGVFVFTSSAPTVLVGDAVSVIGTVTEFIPTSDPNSRSVTELASPGLSVSLASSGNPLPAPITITAADMNPAGSIDQLEHLEGMRVHVDTLDVVAPTQGSANEANATSTPNGVFYGVIPPNGRPFREPGIETPDPLPPGAPCCVPTFDANPERLRVDSDGQAGVFPGINVTTYATVTDLTGVLDYSFRSYTILPDSTPSFSGNISAIPVSTPDEHEFTVAGANVERFFDTSADPDHDDAVLTAAAYAKRLAKVSMMIRDEMLSPDVIGMVEVENLAVLQDIADKVNADAVAASQPNPGYAAYLEEGNDIGGIDVGFLVSSRVTVDSVTQEGLTATYINPVTNAPELLNDRPPLVLRGSVANGSGFSTPITVIVNHLRSLNGVDADPGDGPRVRAKRRAQAEFLANLVAGIEAGDPGERVILVGDFNAFQFNDGYVDSIGTIKGTPADANEVTLASSDLVDPDLVNLVDLEEASERYSYVFDGNAQSLDHAIITSNTVCIVTGMEHARVNADFPESYRGDGTRPERISDHDPLVAFFRFPQADVAPDVANPYAVKVAAPGGTSPSFTLRATLTDPAPNSTSSICDAIPVVVTLTPVGPGSPVSMNATVESCDGTSLVVSATFSGVPVNVYDVTFTVDTLCYQGTGASVLAVYDPSLGFTTGGGRLVNPNTGRPANFGFNVKYSKKGEAQGSVLYMEHDPAGEIRAKSNSMKSLSIVGDEAIILTKNATVTPEPGADPVGGYSIRVRAIDNGDPGSSDMFGLQVIDPDGGVVADLTYDPQTIAGGNIQVPQRPAR